MSFEHPMDEPDMVKRAKIWDAECHKRGQVERRLKETERQMMVLLCKNAELQAEIEEKHGQDN